MRVASHFTGTVEANSTRRWFAPSWPRDWNVVWTVVPTAPIAAAPQIEWTVEVQNLSEQHVQYWITVRNLTAERVTVEARYAVVN